MQSWNCPCGRTLYDDILNCPSCGRVQSREVSNTQMNPVLQRKVDEALDIAVFEDGYEDLMSTDEYAIAVDLCSFSSELENDDVDAVARHVRDYQTWYRNHEAVPTHPRRG